MSSAKIKIRPFTASDHPMLTEWWKSHGWAGVSLACLPSIGGITYKDDETAKPLAAAFLYMDNSSPMCWIEWIVSNPENTPQESYKGIIAVVNHLRGMARSWDYQICMTTCRQKALAKLLTKRCEFEQTDDGVIHLIQGLQ